MPHDTPSGYKADLERLETQLCTAIREHLHHEEAVAHSRNRIEALIEQGQKLFAELDRCKVLGFDATPLRFLIGESVKTARLVLDHAYDSSRSSVSTQDDLG